MQRHILIITALVLTIGTILSSESGPTSSTAAPPAAQEFSFAAPLQCNEVRTLLVDFSMHNPEPDVLSMSLKAGEGGSWSARYQLELDAGKLRHAVEAAAQRLIGTQQSYSF